MSLTWRDNATNETGFYLQRCAPGIPPPSCTNYSLIATLGPRNNTGNVTYVDRTVAWDTSYMYQVAAFNGAGDNVSAPPTGPVLLPAIPAAPTSLTVSVAKATGNNYTATLNWNDAVDPANFTIQRATNLGFTRGLTTFTAAGTARDLT